MTGCIDHGTLDCTVYECLLSQANCIERCACGMPCGEKPGKHRIVGGDEALHACGVHFPEPQLLAHRKDMPTKRRFTKSLLQFFEYDHLPENLRGVSELCAYLAHSMANEIEVIDENPSPELIAGLRKLLEAKDCFVRAKLYKDQ